MVCEYNRQVDCEAIGHCGKCGFNPMVDKERKKRIKEDDFRVRRDGLFSLRTGHKNIVKEKNNV